MLLDSYLMFSNYCTGNNIQTYGLAHRWQYDKSFFLILWFLIRKYMCVYLYIYLHILGYQWPSKLSWPPSLWWIYYVSAHGFILWHILSNLPFLTAHSLLFVPSLFANQGHHSRRGTPIIQGPAYLAQDLSESMSESEHGKWTAATRFCLAGFHGLLIQFENTETASNSRSFSKFKDLEVFKEHLGGVKIEMSWG